MRFDTCLKLRALELRLQSQIPSTVSRTFFSGFSASVNYGTVVGILGLNGSGKSTLLKLLTQRLQPTRGEVVWDRPFFTVGGGGVSVEQGIAPFLLPWLTGQAHVQMLHNSKIGPYKRNCVAQLSPLLEPLLEKPVFKLSGGERQTLALCLLFSLSWEIGVFDEPFSAIDSSRARTLLINLLGRQLSEHPRRTLFMVSHRLDQLIYLCNEIWILNSQGDTISIQPNPYKGDTNLLSGHLPEDYMGHLQALML